MYDAKLLDNDLPFVLHDGKFSFKDGAQEKKPAVLMLVEDEHPLREHFVLDDFADEIQAFQGSGLPPVAIPVGMESAEGFFLWMDKLHQISVAAIDQLSSRLSESFGASVESDNDLTKLLFPNPYFRIDIPTAYLQFLIEQKFPPASLAIFDEKLPGRLGIESMLEVLNKRTQATEVRYHQTGVLVATAHAAEGPYKGLVESQNIFFMEKPYPSFEALKEILYRRLIINKGDADRFALRAENEKQRGELEFRELKRRLLIAYSKRFTDYQLGEIPGFDCSMYHQMAEELGGDFCFSYRASETRYGIVLLDFSGHGEELAAYPAWARGTLEGIHAVLQHLGTKDGMALNLPLEEIVHTVNMCGQHAVHEELFATGYFLEWDEAKGEMSAVIVGGDPFWVYDGNGKCRRFGESSSPLFQMIPDDITGYTKVNFPVQESGAIILYTDGLNETLIGPETQYGHDRIHQRLLKADLGQMQAKQIKELVMADLLENANQYKGGYQEDDRTLLVLRRLPTLEVIPE